MHLQIAVLKIGISIEINELYNSRVNVEHTTALRIAAKKLELAKYALIGHATGRSVKCDPEMQLYAITVLSVLATNDGIAEPRRKNSAVQITKQRVTRPQISEIYPRVQINKRTMPQNLCRELTFS